MRLGIFSDAQHFLDAEGRLCTLTPLARQLEQWASMFDEVVVCAPLHPGPPGPLQTPYRAANLRIEPVAPAGGSTLAAKAALAARLPGWWRALQRTLRRVDAVHVRCPNNVSIPGLLALERTRHLRQALFTGNWEGYPGEARTYRWQRRYLARRFRGPVAVYGDWPGQPPHVVPTFSPVFTHAEWAAEESHAGARAAALRGAGALPDPVRLVSVGALDRNKNQRLAVHAVRRLAGRGVGATLDLLGDGPERGALEALAASLGVEDRVRFHGRVPHEAVRGFLREAHFAVQPSRTEGFSKAVVEAMMHGAVPLLGDLPVHRGLVDGGARGRTFDAGDADALAGHVAELAADPARVAAMVEACRAYTRGVTLEAWREHIRGMLREHWKVAL